MVWSRTLPPPSPSRFLRSLHQSPRRSRRWPNCSPRGLAARSQTTRTWQWPHSTAHPLDSTPFHTPHYTTTHHTTTQHTTPHHTARSMICPRIHTSCQCALFQQTSTCGLEAVVGKHASHVTRVHNS